MAIETILIASIVVQLVALGLGIQLMRQTGRHATWALFLMALLLMVSRRVVALMGFDPGDVAASAHLEAETIALVISVLLLGGLFGISAMFRENRLTEKRLEESKARYQHIFQYMLNGCGIYEPVFDAAGEPIDARWMEVNPAFERMTGLAVERVSGRLLSEVLPADYVPIWLERHREVILDRRPGEFEFYSAYFQRWYHLFTYPIGEHGFVTMFYDITVRHRMELETAMFRRMTERANYGVAILTREGAIQYVNPTQANLFGLEPKALVGRPFFAFVEQGQREWLRGRFAGLGERGQLDNLEVNCLHNDGSIYPTLQNVILIPGESEGTDCLAVTTIDVRELKSLEQQLRQSQKMESIGQLAGGVAHDFNNLLMVILGYTEMAQAEVGANHPAVGMLEEIGRAGERGGRLVQQLLAFSRRQQLRVEAMNLNRIVAEMEGMLRRLIGEKVELSVRLDPELGNMRGDIVQIQQILMNLAVNARDAMPNGGRLLVETANAVRAEGPAGEGPAGEGSEAEGGACVRLTVSDTGGGMDRATQERIFEPFFTTKTRDQGTGLGLSTVHGIVKQLGGEIEVDSAPGRGTTFHVVFPRQDDAALAHEEGDDATAHLRGEACVLVVEDDRQVRVLAAKVLERHGYRMLEANGAAEALRIFEQDHPEIDLVLIDVVMPEMDGPELYNRLKAAQPNLKVLFMSGYSQGRMGGVAGEMGELPFVQKPFSGRTLLVGIQEALRRDPLGGTLR